MWLRVTELWSLIPRPDHPGVSICFSIKQRVGTPGPTSPGSEAIQGLRPCCARCTVLVGRWVVAWGGDPLLGLAPSFRGWLAKECSPCP